MTMRTVRRLLWGEIARSVAFVAAAFLALFYFIDLVDELQNVGKGGWQVKHAVAASLLALPGHLYDLLPIALLIGATYAMARFAQSSEFTILRTGGLGPGRALGLLMGLGALAGIVTFILGDTLVPWAESRISLVEAATRDVGARRGPGAWLRDSGAGNGAPSYVIHVGQAGGDGDFAQVTRYEFDASGLLLSRVVADKVSIDDDGRWRMSGVTRIRLTGDLADEATRLSTERLPQLQWDSRLSANVVAAAVLPLRTMSTPALYTYMNHLADNAQAAQLYEIQFWKRALYPLACLVMMSLALPFAYLHARSEGISLKVFGGIMLGISFVLVNNITSHLGLLQNWSPLLAAALPSLAYMLLALGAFVWLVRYR